MEPIAERILAVRERIERAARRAGRSPDDVRLVGVTKTHPPELVAQALDAGLTEFGENRVQEAEAKITALDAARHRLTWHLIGHLQSNKARRAAALFDLIHSVDSLKLAQALDRHVADVGQPRAVNDRAPLDVLLQVNVSGEASKEGFALAGWEDGAETLDPFLADVERILALPHLRVRGLMTIAPWGSSPEQARPTFSSARRLRDLLARRFPATEWPHLSMGMTDDFEVAIEEGATIVRVGRAIFGAR
jgi:PLP dependent protein